MSKGHKHQLELEESKKLKRFEDAIKGRKLSGTAAFQINNVLGTHYEQDEKLTRDDSARLGARVLQMRVSGVVPATSLLTPCQQSALKKKRGQA